MKLTKIQRNWVIYDIACSAFTLILTVTIPVYFRGLIDIAGINEVCNNSLVQLLFSKNAELALNGNIQAYEALKTSLFAASTTLSVFIVAIIAPILGAIADYYGLKKKLFIISLLIGIGGLMLLTSDSGWFMYMIYLMIARIAYSACNIFYDSMLVDIAKDEEMDKVSSYGYAYGYIGSVLPFVIGLYLILVLPFNLDTISATKISFIIVAIWWFIGALPLILRYKQQYGLEPNKHIIKDVLTRVRHTIKVVSNNKKILYYIIGYFCYIDGVYTIISMSTSYGAEVGISDNVMIIALLVTQIIAFPFSLLAANISKKYDTLNIIIVYVIIYMGIIINAYFLDTSLDFWILCILVAMAQGGIQSLSRSYYSKIIPKDNASEYFGFFDIFGRFADFFGPLIVTICVTIFGESKYGILALLVLFIIGLILLLKVRKLNKYEQ